MSGRARRVSPLATADGARWRDGTPIAPALPGAGDIEWDEFVAATHGGDLVQTSAWAAAKRALGLEVRRVVLREGQSIAGGGQIVVKRFGALGGIGYIARGPLIATPQRPAAVLERPGPIDCAC